MAPHVLDANLGKSPESLRTSVPRGVLAWIEHGRSSPAKPTPCWAGLAMARQGKAQNGNALRQKLLKIFGRRAWLPAVGIASILEFDQCGLEEGQFDECQQPFVACGCVA